MSDNMNLLQSSMEAVAELSFLPMTVVDLDAVLAVERVSHIHPWTHGNF